MAVLDKIQINTIAADIDEIVRYNELARASQLSAQIKETLKQGGLSDDLVKAMNRYLSELQFVRFLAISDSELQSLFSHYLTLAYEIPEYDLVQKFGDRFALEGFPDQQAEFLDKAVKALEQNDELLGTATLKLKDGEVKQTIGNWIKFYNETPFTNHERGPLEAIQFVQKNGFLLSESEKLILTETLKIYNGSKNWLVEYNSLPEATENDEIPDSVLLDMLYGPEESPEVSAPRLGIARNMDGVKLPQSQLTTKPSKAPLSKTEQSPGLRDAQVDPINASRLEELLHKNGSQQPAQEVPAVSPDAIEAKLAELKNRVNKE